MEQPLATMENNDGTTAADVPANPFIDTATSTSTSAGTEAAEEMPPQVENADGEDNRDDEAWVIGTRNSLSFQNPCAAVDEDYYVSTVAEMQEMDADDDGENGENNDDDAANANPFVLGDVDMIYEAAVQLCIPKTTHKITDEDREIYKVEITSMPVVVLTKPSALQAGLAHLVENKHAAALIAMTVPMVQIAQREAAELGFLVASELANPHSSLEKCLFVITDDDDVDTGRNDSIEYNDDNLVRRGAKNVTTTLMGGLMSRTNFFYWYNAAVTPVADMMAMCAKDDFSVRQLETDAARAARSNACELRNSCLRTLKDM